MEDQRAKFEEWIGKTPMYRKLDRWTDNSCRLNGHYCDAMVQFCWYSWCESVKQNTTLPPKTTTLPQSYELGMKNEFTLENFDEPKKVRRFHRVQLSPKQSIIVNQIEVMGSITLSAAVNMIGRDIYHNADKHVGALLSNMVKRSMMVRLRPGVFGKVKK